MIRIIYAMSETRLLCSWFCPFAQRAWIGLQEKEIPYKYEEIDPYNKTEEFLKFNPRGLVPVIVHNGKAIYESTVCLEYMDEAWPDKPKLMPKDPYDRAVVRIWADFVTKKIIPFFYSLLMKEDAEVQKEGRKSFLENVEAYTKAMSPTGPYFMGEQFGLIDIMLYPWIQRMPILKFYRNFEIPTDTDWYPRFQTWYKACRERKKIIPTVADDQRLIDEYKRYAHNTTQSQVAQAIRAGKALP